MRQRDDEVPRLGGQRARRDLATAVGVTAVAAAVVTAAGIWAADVYGPRFGFYLAPPSPARYSQIALDIMESGLYADGVAWQEARDGVETAAEHATDIADLYPTLAAAVEVAGGRHSLFVTPAEARTRRGLAAADFQVPSVTTEDGITTIVVPALGLVSAARLAEYAQTASRRIDAAATSTCGWVVDVRGNTGGDMGPMLSAVSALLPNGPAMSFDAPDGDTFTVTVSDTGGLLDGTPRAPVLPVPKVGDRPIAVLQDAETASSGEAVATMFRGLDGVQSFGLPTAGFTSGNVVTPLYDGALLVLTTSVFVDRDGVSLDEQPITPDVTTARGAVAPQAALDWLRTQGCDE